MMEQAINNNSGYLEIILGPMFSGKTSRLIEMYSKFYHLSNCDITVVNHIIDDRYSSDHMSTHDQRKIPCIFTEKLDMIVEKIKQIGQEISVLEGTERLQYLIDNAKNSKSLANEYKIEQNKIPGCASNLWVVGTKMNDGTMEYQFDADAFITKGTAKLIVDLLNNEKASEIEKLKKDDFSSLGILELLTAQRQSGLSNLIETLIRLSK